MTRIVYSREARPGPYNRRFHVYARPRERKPDLSTVTHHRFAWTVSLLIPVYRLIGWHIEVTDRKA